MSQEFKDKQYKQRTIRQNKALHVYFKLLAKSLNDAGLDMKAVLKPEVEIPWSKHSVKEYLWRPVQNIQLGKKSTTQLTTVEIDIIFDTLNRHLSEKFGIQEDFPSIERIMREMDRVE